MRSHAMVHAFACSGLLAGLGLTVACTGGDDPAGGASDAAPVPADAGLLEPLPPAGGQQLTTLEYTLQPGEEKYFCYTFRSPPAAQGIVEVGNLSGQLVHHVALFETRAPEPEGFSECPVLIRFTWQPIWAGGTGANGLVLPAGTAFKVAGETQYLVQYHLQNTGEVPITERSAINLTYADPAPLTAAGIFAMGQFQLSIPEGAMGFEQTVECVADKQMQVFAAFPHMHKLGKKLEFFTGADAESANVAYAIDPWPFGDQPFDPVDFTIEPGQFLRARCTWDNTTGHPVEFGESSDDEMCFFVLYYYPFEGLSGCGF